MKLFYSFIFYLHLALNAQESSMHWEHAFVNDLNHYNINKLETYLSQTNNNDLKVLLKHEISWWINGGQEDLKEIKSETKEETKRESILKKMFLGDHFSRSKEDHLIALENYQEALSKARSIQDKFFEKEIIFRLVYLLKKNSRGEEVLLKIKNDFLNELIPLLNVPVDRFRFLQLTIDIKMKNMELNATTEEKNEIRKAFAEMKELSSYNKLFSIYYHRQFGIYLEVFENDYVSAGQAFSLTLKEAEKIPFHFIQSKIPEIQHSKAIVLFRLKQYPKAIDLFQNLLTNPYFQENQIAKMYLNEWLFKCYEKEENYKKALTHFTAFKRIYENLDRKKHARLILKMQNDNTLNESQKSLEQLEKKHLSLLTQFNTILPIATTLLLLAVLLFWLYKKTQLKKHDLEKEKINTLEEFKALKKLVIKNHIVLKDKTKIYINDLLYVKAEDHYIRLFIADNKNHFVRGRLSDLETELPPNFIRIHRSYIINRNYVKSFSGDQIQLINGERIPIGRTYRKKIDH